MAFGAGLWPTLLRVRGLALGLDFLKTSKRGCGGGQPLHKDNLNQAELFCFKINCIIMSKNKKGI